MKELKIRMMERMLGAELAAHLGYEAGSKPPAEQTNRRYGVATKRVKGPDGEVPLAVPRDQDGSFEPEQPKKGQTRIDGVDDKTIGLYAAGLQIARHPGRSGGPLRLAGLADLISRVTDSALCLQRGDPEDYLHHQRGGVAEPASPGNGPPDRCLSPPPSIRKVLKTRGSFPTEEAAIKLIFLAKRNFEKDGRAVRESVAARNRLAIVFAGRLDA